MEIKVKIIVELGDHTLNMINKLIPSVSSSTIPNNTKEINVKSVKVTLDTLKDTVKSLVESGYAIEIKRLLESYNANKLDNISPDDYRSFYNKLLRLKK